MLARPPARCQSISSSFTLLRNHHQLLKWNREQIYFHQACSMFGTHCCVSAVGCSAFTRLFVRSQRAIHTPNQLTSMRRLSFHSNSNVRQINGDILTINRQWNGWWDRWWRWWWWRHTHMILPPSSDDESSRNNNNTNQRRRRFVCFLFVVCLCWNSSHNYLVKSPIYVHRNNVASSHIRHWFLRNTTVVQQNNGLADKRTSITSIVSKAWSVTYIHTGTYTECCRNVQGWFVQFVRSCCWVGCLQSLHVAQTHMT